MISKHIRQPSLWIFIVIVAFFCFNLQALDLSFKVSYALSYTAVGDTNDYIKSFSQTDPLLKPFDQIHFGGQLAGEIYFKLHPRISIFVGTGKILLSKKDDKRYTEYVGPINRNIEGFDHTIEAIPLLLGIRYDLNLSRDPSRFYFKPHVIIFLKAAAGYYFTTWNRTYEHLEHEYYPDVYSTYGWAQQIEIKQTADANHFGASGAVGMEIRLTRRLSVVFEASGRTLRVNNYQGEYRYSSSYLNDPDQPGTDMQYNGTLYYYEYHQDNQWRTELKICEKPEGPDIRNVRPAEVDFSGFSFCFGIKINL